MKKDSILKNNKGYSLVEFIIVFGIIVIFAGAATITLSVMHSAKAKEAGTKFESELAELSAKAKSESCVVSGTVMSDYKFALRIYKNADGKYYLKHVYYVGMGDMSSASNYVDGDDNPNGGKGISLSTYVTVKYEDSSGNKSAVDNNGKFIIFDRKGMCISGDGKYSFYKTSGGGKVAEVKISKNGSRQSR